MSASEFYDVDMHIDDLANFMFLENKNNVTIDLSLGGVQNNKDFFFFCLDLFCKGLVLMFGNGTKAVCVEELSFENFTLVKKRMECAGIMVFLNLIPADIESDDASDTANAKLSLNLEELEKETDDKPLESYEFRLKNDTLLYLVSFKLIHNM
jgi:hypothetical protein